MKSIFLLCLLTLLSSPLYAEQFQAPLTNTHWQVVKSPLSCALTQTIPDFGVAGFYRKDGGALILKFTTFSQPASPDNAQFEVAQAPWQNSADHLTLASIATKRGQKSFVLHGLAAQQALSHLQEGQFPLLRYHSQTTNQNISVVLSTIHLADSLPAFQKCLNKLYPDTFAKVQFLTIYFDLQKSDLTAASKKALLRLAGYVKIDDSITAVHVESHTDNHGHHRLNGPLSKARSVVVKNFLTKQGKVPEKLITLSSRVELDPAASNKTQMGRAKNRRAEITLIR